MKYFVYLLLLFNTIAIYAKETRQKIVVIDTGYNRAHWSNLPVGTICENGMLDVTGTGPQDNHGHGTNIVGLIANGIDTKRFCIVSIKWYDTDFKVTLPILTGRIRSAIKLAEQQNPYLVNLSSSGSSFDSIEQMIISRMTYRGIKVVVSAGNDGFDLQQNCNIYPACYNANQLNYYVVGGVDKLNKIFSRSNRSGPVRYYEDAINKCGEGVCMSGTSQAAAVKSNKLIRGIR
jgi:subtilisin family serine protease